MKSLKEFEDIENNPHFLTALEILLEGSSDRRYLGPGQSTGEMRFNQLKQLVEKIPKDVLMFSTYPGHSFNEYDDENLTNNLLSFLDNNHERNYVSYVFEARVKDKTVLDFKVLTLKIDLEGLDSIPTKWLDVISSCHGEYDTLSVSSDSLTVYIGD